MKHTMLPRHDVPLRNLVRRHDTRGGKGEGRAYLGYHFRESLKRRRNDSANPEVMSE
jgi:hypothetical protein